jgi:putative FmdB family regulatory protein
MPIYQYDCSGCDSRVEVFFRSVKSVGDAECPECGSADLARVVSQVARGRSAGQRLDDVDFNQEMGRLESGDVGGFARWTRQMGERYDEELGSDFRDMADRADAGEDPIERVDVEHTLRYALERKRQEISDDSSGSGSTTADGNA